MKLNKNSATISQPYFIKKNDVIAVFAAIIFPLYSWSIYSMLEYIPSLILSMTIGEIMALNAYIFAWALIESLTILGVILLTAFVLPKKWLRNKFTAKGSAVVWLLFIVAMLAQINMQNITTWTLVQYYIYLPIIITTYIVLNIVVLFFISKFLMVEKFIRMIVNRLEIFLYIYLPISVVSFVIVIIRNFS